jgi:hypothetical protein
LAKGRQQGNEPRTELTPQQARGGDRASELIGFQEIGCHIIFDVKMDFTRKARSFTGGHTTTAPSSMTFAFLISALNDLGIMSCDLKNAYLNVPCREMIWFEGGIECGEDYGKVCIVVRSLYGLKSAGAASLPLFPGTDTSRLRL